MKFKMKSVKPLFMATAIAGIAALSSASNATITYSMIAGGSSALLGNFTAGSYAAGAIPTVLGNSGLTITGYRDSGIAATVDKAYLMNGTIKATDGTFVETISAALIRVLDDGAGNVRVVIILRTDSGQGVRYVANAMKISDLSGATFFNTDGTSVSTIATSDTTNPDLIVKLKADATVGNLPIQTGFSDVAAATIIRYGTGQGVGNYAQPGPTVIPGSGAGSISVSGLGTSKVAAKPLPIQTLLLLYQFTNTAPVNFSRNQVRNILSGTPNTDGLSPIYWENILPNLNASTTQTPVVAAYRENASGTRNTMFVDVLQGLKENQFGNVIDPQSVISTAFQNPQNGSGNMINSVNRAVNSFGYSFVTGTAGNGKGLIRVGAYNGVLPYSPTATTAVSLPNNNGQAAYGITAYYTEVINGKYELWATAQEISIKGTSSQTVAESIQSTLESSTFAGTVHSLGFTRNAEMQAVRSAFVSPVTGETVTDGQFISFDTGNTASGGILGGNIIQ